MSVDFGRSGFTDASSTLLSGNYFRVWRVNVKNASKRTFGQVFRFKCGDFIVSFLLPAGEFSSRRLAMSLSHSLLIILLIVRTSRNVHDSIILKFNYYENINASTLLTDNEFFECPLWEIPA